MTPERIKRLRSALAERKIDNVLIASAESRRYTTGFTGSSGWVLVTLNNVYLFTDFRYTEQATMETKLCQVIEYQDFVVSFKEIIEKESLTEIYFEQEKIYYSEYLELKNKLDPINFLPSNINFQLLRMKKDQDEIDNIRKAAEIADKAFDHILAFIKPGISELDIADELEYCMKKLGSTKPAFDTIIASGSRSSLPHGVATAKKVNAGEFITMDYGAVVNGYHSDMTRTIMVGQASREQRDLYLLVQKAQAEALHKVAPGIKASFLDNLTRDIFAEEGYLKEFGHGLGHGVGLEIHEEPRVSKKSPFELAEGMIITIEPGLYLEGRWGVRIEDLVVVKNAGYDILSKSTKELLEI